MSYVVEAEPHQLHCQPYVELNLLRTTRVGEPRFFRWRRYLSDDVEWRPHRMPTPPPFYAPSIRMPSILMRREDHSFGQEIPLHWSARHLSCASSRYSVPPAFISIQTLNCSVCPVLTGTFLRTASAQLPVVLNGTVF